MLTLAVPNLNGAAFLSRTLESLNSQGDCVRWWLQDGGSRDGSQEIAQRLKRRQDVVVSEPDGGQTDALNRAFSRMGGDIVGYLNSDDVLRPGAAEKVLGFFERNPKVDLVYGGVEYLNASEVVLGQHHGDISSLSEILNIYDVWWHGRQWVQPEVFWRRSLAEKTGKFDGRYHLAFDYDYWVRCFMSGARVAAIPEILAGFRKHAAQKSTDSLRAAREIRNSVSRHMNVLPVFERMVLGARLDYDHYQQQPAAEKKGMACSLLQKPSWWLALEVRDRIKASLKKTNPK